MNSSVSSAPGRPHLRTDVRYMRKAELFKSSGEFLLAGVLATGLYFIVRTLVGPPLEPQDSKGTVQTWVIALTLVGLIIMAGMGVLGALYLFMRGCFRSRKYDPHQVWLADEPKPDQRAP